MGIILNRALRIIFAMMVALARYGQHGSVVELAYTADLKSATFGFVGSSPTAPTSSEFSSAPF